MDNFDGGIGCHSECNIINTLTDTKKVKMKDDVLGMGTNKDR